MPIAFLKSFLQQMYFNKQLLHLVSVFTLAANPDLVNFSQQLDHAHAGHERGEVQ